MAGLAAWVEVGVVVVVSDKERTAFEMRTLRWTGERDR